MNFLVKFYISFQLSQYFIHSMHTSVRIGPISRFPTSRFTLFLPSGIAFLSNFGLSYARTLEIAYHEGLFIRISTELYDPNIFRPHFVYCTYDIIEANEEEIIINNNLYMILVTIVIIYFRNIFGRKMHRAKREFRKYNYKRNNIRKGESNNINKRKKRKYMCCKKKW